MTEQWEVGFGSLCSEGSSEKSFPQHVAKAGPDGLGPNMHLEALRSVFWVRRGSEILRRISNRSRLRLFPLRLPTTR